MDNDLALMFQARRLDTLKSVALDVGLSEPWHTSILTINDKISVGSFACTFTDVKYVK